MKKRIINFTIVAFILFLSSCAYQKPFYSYAPHGGSKKCAFEVYKYEQNSKAIFDNGYNVRKSGSRPH